MFGRDLNQPPQREGGADLLQAIAAVAFDSPLHQHEQVGPDRLRAGEAAPQPAGEGVRQDQDGRGEDQQPGHIIEFLRPDLDEEGVEAGVLEIEQDGLVRLADAALPAQEWREIIDRQRHDQDGPLDPADGALDRLRDNRRRGARAGRPCARPGMVDLDDGHGGPGISR